MKKSFFATTLAMIFVSLLAVACTPKDDQPEAATLSLSANTLTFDNKAQNPAAPQITVTTNQAKFRATTTDPSWLKVAEEGNGLKITAMANELGRERVADVLVFAGGLVEKVVVTQSAADVVLEVSPEEQVIPNTGKEFYVSVKSNSDRWEIEAPQVDWIKVQKFTTELVKVVVEANNDEAVREYKLFAKLGNVQKEVSITQVGTGSSTYMLPLLVAKVTNHAIIDHEAKQGNYLMSYSSALPGWGYFDESFQFACGSKVFETVIYQRDVRTNKIKDIVMYSLDNEAVASEGFRTYLIENGFELTAPSENGNYKGESAEASFAVVVAIGDATKYSTVQFIPIIKQSKPYPTFKKFPYDMWSRLNKDEWKSADIIKAEEKDGNKIEKIYDKKYPTLLSLIWVDIKENSDREVPTIRAYFMDNEEDGTTTDRASELITIWKDQTVGAWADGTVYYLTDEFKALMEAEGFKFFTKNQGSDLYYLESEQLMIVPRGVSFTDVLDGAPVFSINYFKYVKKEGSKAEIAADIQKRLDRMDAQMGIIK